jgi:BirA family biotin operon repressor/biotin-[acetyl-CoA-carboxylase] ligase
MAQESNKIVFRASDGNTVRLEHRESLPSAAALAKEYANAGYPDRYAVYTEKQTALSALGTPLSENQSENGLYVSCILRPSIFPSQAGAIGALSSVAFASALEEHTSKNIGIGWVSSIYCEGVKIGETSVEGKLDDFTSYEYLIVSFSVKMNEKNFPPRLTDIVRRVFEEDSVSVSMIMAKTVLNKFFAVYRELKNPAKHINAYVSRSVLLDKKIKFIDDGKKKACRVIGINRESLALIVEGKDGRRHEITSPSGVVIPNKI